MNVQDKLKQDALKRSAAQAAFNYIQECGDNKNIVGIGTGSTVNFFIDLLADREHGFETLVASSGRSAARLNKLGLNVVDANQASKIDVYIDGMDAINAHRQMIKGGGGALTGEKILASMADVFIAIGDASKCVDCLDSSPVAVEVIGMARSFVAREIVKRGGEPVYRSGFISDYGNPILDVYNLSIDSAQQLEQDLNQIAGVVTNGIFARRKADKAFISSADGIRIL